MTALALLPRFDTAHGVVYAATRRQIEAYAPWKASFANQRKDWRYYQIVEDTIIQGFDYRYFILEDTKGEVRAVQPFFLLDQDLLQGSGEFARKMIARVRRLIPKALTMRTLMVGCAAGEGHLDYTSDEQARWVAGCLHGALRSYARQHKCRLVVLKEFPQNYRKPLESFASNGYARVPSLPMVRLSIDYASFEQYMSTALSKVTRKGLPASSAMPRRRRRSSWRWCRT